MQGGKAAGLPERGWAVAEIFIAPLGMGSRHERTAMGTLGEP